MNNPWGFLITCKSILGDVWDAAAGNLTRQLTSLFLLALVGTIIYNIEGDEADKISVTQLQTALKVTKFFEIENRGLSQELDDERRQRQLAEQTITALAENIKEQDGLILDQKQQISFYRQLLEERGRNESDATIRTFDIVPDFRDDYQQLSAVIVRNGADNKPFKGRIDLALSLVDANGGTFEHRPIFEDGILEIEFRYYHEAQAVFPIPKGTEILNAQLVMFDKQGDPVVSRTLHEQGE